MKIINKVILISMLFISSVFCVGKAGTTAQVTKLFRWQAVANDTFVWNDKFSFNGYEPTNFTGPLDDATKQNAIADQGSGVSQWLYANTTHADDSFEVIITYIDQNNA